jgi:hypothetical protein
MYPDDGTDAEQLLAAADRRLAQVMFRMPLDDKQHATNWLQ